MQQSVSQANRTLRRLWLVAGWGLVLLIVWLSLTPRAISVPVSEGDKIGHFLAYGTLMFWFAQIYLAQKSRWMVAAAAVALGIALEFAQLLTDTRTFSIADMLADGAGVLLGWVAAPPRSRNVLSAIETAWPNGSQRP